MSTRGSDRPVGPSRAGVLRAAGVFLLVAAIPMSALADPIAIDFTARVTSTIDDGGYLGSAISVGDIITGRYLYESTTPDTNILPTVGDYRHSEAPFGISLDVNGLVFRTNPAAVRFLVEVVDNHPMGDQYLLGSYTNIFPVSVPASGLGPPVNEIFWFLRDSMGAALDSSGLPTQPPALAVWPERTLQITSENYDEARFVVDAEIISVAAVPEAVPEPATLLLLASGLLGLSRRCRRR